MATECKLDGVNQDINDFNAEFMKLALKQAQNGKDSNEVPVGCVIVRDNEIVIASAHNQTNITKNATKHCEIICIEYLGSERNIYSLSDCYLYVTVEPCIMCASALKIVNVKKVFYGCSNTKFGGNGSVYSLNLSQALGFPDLCFSSSYPSIKVGGEYEQSAIKLLKTFYESGNELCPINKRARKRIKLDNHNSNNSNNKINKNNDTNTDRASNINGKRMD